jgi:hypothetical protein
MLCPEVYGQSVHSCTAILRPILASPGSRPGPTAEVVQDNLPPPGNLRRESRVDPATLTTWCTRAVWPVGDDIMRIGRLGGKRMGRKTRCLVSMKHNHERSVKPSPS